MPVFQKFLIFYSLINQKADELINDKKKKRFVAALTQNQNNTHTHTNIKPSPSTSSSVIQFAIINVNYVPECSAAPNHKPMCESH